MNKTITALVIMDGYGLSKQTKGNAIGTNCSPYVRYLLTNYPASSLDASGMAVGLPEGQMGNSEVGHLNIGAGRVIYQELTRITKSISDGDFFSNSAFKGAVDYVKKSGGKLHFMGLMSNGGVHSHINHVYALLELAKREGLQNAYVHCYMDGRDVSPTSGVGFVEQLQAKMSEIQFGKPSAADTTQWTEITVGTGWKRLTTCCSASAKIQPKTPLTPLKRVTRQA